MKTKVNNTMDRLQSKVPSLVGVKALDVAMYLIDNPSIQPQVDIHLDSKPNDVVHDLLGLAREDEFFVPRVLF